MIVACDLNNMVDYDWETNKSTLREIHAIQSLKYYKEHLLKSNIYLGLIRDIADCHKHLHLDRKQAEITSATQIQPHSVGWGQVFGYCFGGGDILSVHLDDGQTLPFEVIAEEAFNHWKAEFSGI